MEMIKANAFTELSNQELQSTDGGLVIAGVVVSGSLLLKVGATIATAGFAGGIAVGLNS